MTPNLTDATAVVTGASRGFGLGIATALVAAGARVVGVARDAAALEQAGQKLGSAFTPVTADATDDETARTLIEKHRPSVLVLNAGASPQMKPLHEMTWDDFSRNWHVDTQHAFHWTRAALRLPLAPDSLVVALSSGAVLAGSPLSGGYAGAKATIKYITAYAAEESRRAALGVRFVTLFPQLTPATDLGLSAAAAYAQRQGVDLATFSAAFEPLLTPDTVGTEIVRLIGENGPDAEYHRAYRLSGRGLGSVA